MFQGSDLSRISEVAAGVQEPVGEERVQVVCRCRPTNEREEQEARASEQKKTELCLQSNNASTISVNFLGEAAKNRKTEIFEMDAVLVCPSAAQNAREAQRETFFEVGLPQVGTAMGGYNATIFAYGQTGSGKSFTMNGEEDAPGLIPHMCEALFYLAEERSADTTVDVRMAFMEIYNDKCFDLLGARQGRRQKEQQGFGSGPKDGTSGVLAVRGTQEGGYFVENLSERVVSSTSDVMKNFHEGMRHRATDAHALNKKSSRSHAVLILDITQTDKKSSATSSSKGISSRLTLIDLAGSEKSNRTGASVGSKIMTEGNHINKSLSALGDCIKELTKRHRGGGKGGPTVNLFNQSNLTKVLCSSLQGNSRTVVVAALSPAAAEIAETLSTLRFARQCRGLRNEVKKNILEGDKIRQLEQRIKELETEKRKREEEAPSDGDDEHVAPPYLYNLDKDAQLQGAIKVRLQDVLESGRPLTVGRGADEDGPDKIVRGFAMEIRHCSIHYKRSTDTWSLRLDTSGAKVTINGRSVGDDDDAVLQHGDRVVLGDFTLALVMILDDSEALVHTSYYEAMREHINGEQGVAINDKRDRKGGATSMFSEKMANVTSDVRQFNAVGKLISLAFSWYIELSPPTEDSAGGSCAFDDLLGTFMPSGTEPCFKVRASFSSAIVDNGGAGDAGSSASVKQESVIRLLDCEYDTFVELVRIEEVMSTYHAIVSVLDAAEDFSALEHDDDDKDDDDDGGRTLSRPPRPPVQGEAPLLPRTFSSTRSFFNEVLSRMDTDNDGHISEEELRCGLQKLGLDDVSEEEMRVHFELCPDKTVDLEERSRSIQSLILRHLRKLFIASLDPVLAESCHEFGGLTPRQLFIMHGTPRDASNVGEGVVRAVAAGASAPTDASGGAEAADSPSQEPGEDYTEEDAQGSKKLAELSERLGVSASAQVDAERQELNKVRRALAVERRRLEELQKEAELALSERKSLTAKSAGLAKSVALLATKHGECPVCIEPLCSAPASVMTTSDPATGRRCRSCEHFVHRHCVASLCQSSGKRTGNDGGGRRGNGETLIGHCPICAKLFDGTEDVPSIADDPDKWFEMCDFDDDGELSASELIHILKAQFPVDHGKLRSLNAFLLQDSADVAPNSSSAGVSITQEHFRNKIQPIIVKEFIGVVAVQHAEAASAPSPEAAVESQLSIRYLEEFLERVFSIFDDDGSNDIDIGEFTKPEGLAEAIAAEVNAGNLFEYATASAQQNTWIRVANIKDRVSQGQTNQVPPFQDRSAWFEHFDDDNSSSLTIDEVARALIKSFKATSKSGPHCP